MLLGLLVALALGVAWRWGWPGWPVADADLRFTPAPVPESANAFPVLAAAGQALQFGDRDYFLLDDALKETDFSRARIEAVITANAEALKRFGEAGDRPQFQVPAVPDSQTALPYLDQWQALARLTLFQARFRGEAGDQQAALDELLGLVRFGQRLEGAGGTVAHFALGVQVQRLAAEEILRHLPTLTLPPAALAAAARRLADCQANPDGLRRTCRAEYALWCADLDAIAAGTYRGGYADIPTVLACYPYPRLGLQVNTTRRGYSTFWRALLADLDRPASQRATWDPGPRPLPAPAWRLLLDPNHCGRHLRWDLTRRFAVLPRRAARSEMEVRLCQAALALRGYEREHGSLPAELGQLVPAWLPTAPAAVFSGGELRYCPAQRLLLTGGPGGTSTGMPTPPLPAGPDFSFARFWHQRDPGLVLPP